MKAKSERRSPNWPPAWAALVDACDGPHEAARRLGVHYQTLWRWALRAGTVPPAMRLLVGRLAAELGVRSPV